MNETLEFFLRLIGVIICLGLPAWAFMRFDDHEF